MLGEFIRKTERETLDQFYIFHNQAIISQVDYISLN